jgi:hypothetical protein
MLVGVGVTQMILVKKTKGKPMDVNNPTNKNQRLLLKNVSFRNKKKYAK